MNFRNWKKGDYLDFLTSVEQIWKIKDCNTLLPFYSPSIHEPQFIQNIGPVCRKIIRSKYRIGTDGIITKILIEQPNRKKSFTNCFWKELSFECSEQTPFIEIYATFCASYLRHNHRIKSLAYSYGYINGILSFFTKERHKSSVENVSNPTQYGFRIKKIGDTYANIERQNEPICLLSQEYIPLSFDDVMNEWKEEDYEDEQIRTELVKLLRQIWEGLYQMEKEWGIYHNDMHPGNLMARRNRQTQEIEWCIIDWGRATIQREGCWKKNAIFMPDGPACGQLRLGQYPLTPTSKQHSHTYYASVSGGDIVGLFIMLMKEEYIRRAVMNALFMNDPIWTNFVDTLMPSPRIRGHGLHVFRRANEWARAHHLTLEKIGDLIETLEK